MHATIPKGNMGYDQYTVPDDCSYLTCCCCSLRASSPIWASEASLARTRERGGRGKESLQRSLINFHFHPGNPGTPQSVKIVTANVRQIRKVTTACQVSLDSRGRVELFIYKSLSQQHQSNVFNH